MIYIYNSLVCGTFDPACQSDGLNDSLWKMNGDKTFMSHNAISLTCNDGFTESNSDRVKFI